MSVHTHILVIYCYNKEITQYLTVYDNEGVLFHRTSDSQESKNNLCGYFWLGIFHEVAVKPLLELQSPEGLMGAGEPTSKKAHSYGFWLKTLLLCWFLVEDLNSTA